MDDSDSFYDNGIGFEVDVIKKGPRLFHVKYGHFETTKKTLKFESILSATMCEGDEHKKAFHLTNKTPDHVDIHVNCGNYTENDILKIYNNSDVLNWKAIRRLQTGAVILGAGALGVKASNVLKEAAYRALEGPPAVITVNGITRPDSAIDMNAAPPTEQRGFFSRLFGNN